MNIILVTNKTLNRNGLIKFDSSYYNVFIPLLQLGHNVYFYDTVNPIEKNFTEIVKKFKPHLIFCCISGDKNIAPYEPINEINDITKAGNIKTFNWFCDDTWRFDSFSKLVCKNFTVCSTPEFSAIEKFVSEGYNNIILGQWHCNEELLTKQFKCIDIGFCGGLNPTRIKFFEKLSTSVSYLKSCSYEDMINFYSSCKTVLNLTINDNDVEKKRQMKLRIFEATCANSLLITEQVENLNMYFEPGKEIICFNDVDECKNIIQFYLKNESELLRISKNGYNRFLKEHTSKIRLANILNAINKI